MIILTITYEHDRQVRLSFSHPIHGMADAQDFVLGAKKWAKSQGQEITQISYKFNPKESN